MTEQTVSVRVNMEGKSLLVAYLLWWFLGWAGVHRFYLGRAGSGITQLMLVITGAATAVFFIGYILLAVWFGWWLLDAYFVYTMTAEENQKSGNTGSMFSISKSGNLNSDIDQLEKLHALYEKGVLSREQYEAKKAKLI